jgi:hypothetical protein
MLLAQLFEYRHFYSFRHSQLRRLLRLSSTHDTLLAHTRDTLALPIPQPPRRKRSSRPTVLRMLLVQDKVVDVWHVEESEGKFEGRDCLDCVEEAVGWREAD